MEEEKEGRKGRRLYHNFLTSGMIACTSSVKTGR